MYPDKLHFRHCMFYHFHEGTNALQATKAIRSVYGEDSLNERTSQKCFARFNAGDFYLNDREIFEALLKEYPKQSSTELTLQFSVSHTTVLNRLKAFF